jgi:hypothetical protein
MHDQQERTPNPPVLTGPEGTLAVVETGGVDSSLHIKRQEQLDIDRVVGAFKEIVNAGIDSWHTRAREQAKSTEKELEIDDRKHFRAAMILCYTLTLVVTLCVVALWKNQIELVRIIWTSGLGLGAGAGLRSVWVAARRTRN